MERLFHFRILAVDFARGVGFVLGYIHKLAIVLKNAEPEGYQKIRAFYDTIGHQSSEYIPEDATIFSEKDSVISFLMDDISDLEYEWT